MNLRDNLDDVGFDKLTDEEIWNFLQEAGKASKLSKVKLQIMIMYQNDEFDLSE